MDCHDATARFSDLRDGRLSGVESAELEGHLTICPACRTEWAHFQETIEALRGMTPVAPSPGFAARVRAQIEAPPWHRRLARWLFIPWQVKVPLAAAALVLLAVGTVSIYRRTPEMRQVVERPGTKQAPVPIEAERRKAPPNLTLAYKRAPEGKPKRQATPLTDSLQRPPADEVAPQAKGRRDVSVGAKVSTQRPPEELPRAAPSPSPAGPPAVGREALQFPSPPAQPEAKPAAPLEVEETARSLSLLEPAPTPQPFRIMTLRTWDVAGAEKRIREWIEQAGGRLLDLPAGGESVPSDQRTLSLLVPVQAVARLDALLAELGQLFGKEQEVPPFREALISLTISPKSPSPAKSE